MRGVCERWWSTLRLLWVCPSALQEIDRPHKQHTVSKKTNHEVAFGKMSHLGGFQIQKAIIVIFPIPFWQNYTSAFGRLVHTKTTSVQNLPGKENVSGILERWSRKPNNKVWHITSTNPAAAGKFMHENFQARARFTNNFKQHKCVSAG